MSSRPGHTFVTYLMGVILRDPRGARKQTTRHRAGLFFRLGRQDSNLRMAAPKAAALGHLATPHRGAHYSILRRRTARANAGWPRVIASNCGGKATTPPSRETFPWTLPTGETVFWFRLFPKRRTGHRVKPRKEFWGDYPAGWPRNVLLRMGYPYQRGGMLFSGTDRMGQRSVCMLTVAASLCPEML